MKNQTNTNGIIIALFATFMLFANLNLSAQYKLELEWQKQPGGTSFYVGSITKSDNDSLIYISSTYVGKNLYEIRKINTKDGTNLSIDTVDVGYILKMSKDGQTLVASGGGGVGILDPITFKRIFWDSIPYIDYQSSFSNFSFNEKQNKIVLCSKSYLGKRETFIRVYNLNTKSLLKEFGSSYFGDIAIKNASITDDGKYIIYGYETYTLNPNKTHYFVKMIDLDGKLIKDFGETSSSKFAITIDGKTLIYFDNITIHFFNLATMKEIEGIQRGGANPENIEMSSNGKFMLAGYGGGLVYYDLESKKSFYLRDFGTWRIFKLNYSNNSIIAGQSEDLYKFNFVLTSIISNQNKLDFSINIIENIIILSNPQNHQINNLTAYDILGRTYPLSANGNEVDVSGLSAGRYFLKVGLDDGSYLDFGFVKEL